MAQIVFTPGLTMANLPPTRAVQLIDADWIRGQLETMRQEWSEATGDITRVTCNLGAIFDELQALVGGEG
jgi:hypothetical protein